MANFEQLIWRPLSWHNRSWLWQNRLYCQHCTHFPWYFFKYRRNLFKQVRKTRPCISCTKQPLIFPNDWDECFHGKFNELLKMDCTTSLRHTCNSTLNFLLHVDSSLDRMKMKQNRCVWRKCISTSRATWFWPRCRLLRFSSNWSSSAFRRDIIGGPNKMAGNHNIQNYCAPECKCKKVRWLASHQYKKIFFHFDMTAPGFSHNPQRRGY